jgi:hypothetical protein
MKFSKTIFLGILLLLSGHIIAQDVDSYSSYLKENTQIYSEADGIMPADDYSKYKLFVTGEFHYKEENSKIFLKTFRNLYYNANVRLILFEAGYAYGLIVQHYLETGSYKSLKIISSEGQFDEYHYRYLKDFYDKLPSDEKFSIVGIDLDSYSVKETFRYAVDLQFRDTLMPDTLVSLLDDFEYIVDNEDYEVVQESFGPIFRDFSHNNELYKALLKNRFDEYEQLIDRMRKSLKFDRYNYNYGKDSVAQTLRENFLYKNASDAIKNYPDVNYYGQFGLAHIGLSRFLIMDEESGVESFTAKLQTYDKSPIKDSVCSIAILYFDEFTGGYNKINYYMSEWSYNISLNKILPIKVYKVLKRITETNKIYYVNLAQKNSPLSDIAKKNFQYLIFKR